LENLIIKISKPTAVIRTFYRLNAIPDFLLNHIATVNNSLYGSIIHALYLDNKLIGCRVLTKSIKQIEHAKKLLTKKQQSVYLTPNTYFATGLVINKDFRNNGIAKQFIKMSNALHTNSNKGSNILVYSDDKISNIVTASANGAAIKNEGNITVFKY